MSYEEYVGLGEHVRPYIVHINSPGKSLYYFGEAHSFDPTHTQWKILKDLWQEFINNSNVTSRIALTEGGVRSVAPTAEEAISKGSGMGLVSFLAHEANIPIYSPEPNEQEERVKLEERFSRDEIQYYYFARVVGQWERLLNPRPEFEEYINRYLGDDKKESGWKDYDFSLKAMKELHTKFFDQEFNPEDYKLFEEICKPTHLKTRTNEVSRAVGDIRDEHIVKEIQRYWEEGKSMFVVYGSSHVVRQEKLLKELLQ